MGGGGGEGGKGLKLKGRGVGWGGGGIIFVQRNPGKKKAAAVPTSHLLKFTTSLAVINHSLNL